VKLYLKKILLSIIEKEVSPFTAEPLVIGFGGEG
jgi:hypothetical protein